MKNNLTKLAAGFLAAGLLTVGEVNAADSIAISNPSFEDNASAFVVWPGYLGSGSAEGIGTNPGSIPGWTTGGGAGINGSTIATGSIIFNGSGGVGVGGTNQPFANNGATPDQSSVFFQQGSGSISQTVSGLTVGSQYWIQGFVNSRINGGPTADAKVSYNGTDLIPYTTIPSVGGSNPYIFVNIPFTPTVGSASLVLSTQPTPANPGDAALLLDGISLIQRDADQVVIANPSFEASGASPGVGYQSGGIAGWTVGGSGGYGVNTSAQPFAAGTTIPDGSTFFRQGDGTLSQTINNLSIGQAYELKFFYDARIGTGTPNLLAQIGALTALNTPVVPSASFYTAIYNFTATATSMPLTFTTSYSSGSGDYTTLIDNVSIRAVPEPSSLAMLLCGGAGLRLRRRRRS